MDAATGAIRWNYAAGESVNAGATVVDGVVYWGSGFIRLGLPGDTGGVNKQFYAFSPNGQ
jgi:polyvinyl alcohol dehydrogenase (cytochrome)